MAREGRNPDPPKPKGAAKKQAANDPTGEQKVARRANVARLLVQGKEPVEIARTLGISRQLALRDKNLILKQWNENLDADGQVLRMRMLGKLESYEVQLRQGFEELNLLGKHEQASRIFGMIHKCIETEMKLKGIEDSTKKAPTQGMQVVIHNYETEGPGKHHAIDISATASEGASTRGATIEGVEADGKAGVGRAVTQ